MRTPPQSPPLLPVQTHDGLRRAGHRFRLVILVSLLEAGSDGLRFSDLATTEGLSRRVLSDQLAYLSSLGMVERVKYQQRPERFRYRLTAAGNRAGVHARLLSQAMLGKPVPMPRTQQGAHAERIRPEDVAADLALQKVVAYDERYRTALIDTLAAYITADGSVETTAAALFIHRHTVRYRLGRIEEMTGLSTSSFSDREQFTRELRAIGTLAPLDRH